MIRKWYIIYLDFHEDENGIMQEYQFVETVEAISYKEAYYKALGFGARRIKQIVEAVTDTENGNFINYDLIRFN